MKELIKRLIAVFCAWTLFIWCGEFWRYLLVDDTNSYTRIMMHELYNSEKNIDTLFVGSSHVYRSLIPELLDSGLGCYTFNAGTSSQYMDGSLALIQEASSCNDIKRIYLELYYGVASGGDYDARTELTSTYIISDYMRLSINKICYLLNASSSKYWVNSFILARRDWENFFDSNYVKNLLLKKSEESYRNFEWEKTDDALEFYVDRGFVASEEVVPENTCFDLGYYAYNGIDVGNTITLDSDWGKSIEQIVEFCKRKGIELTFFVAPEMEAKLVAVGNYQEYHDFISRMSDIYGIELYDFNLCRPEYFNANNKNLFKDEQHLNENGAKAFSAVFSDFFAGHIEQTELFYDNFEEKIRKDNIEFYGVSGPKESENTDMKEYRIITGNVDEYEFYIVATPEKGEQRIIQEFSNNLQFELPIDEKGTLTVAWRKIRDNGNIQTVEFLYG